MTLTKTTAPKKTGKTTAKKSTKPKGKETGKVATVKEDVYAKITNRIVEQLEKGVRPWMQPWSGGAGAGGAVIFPKRVTGQRYSGINVMLLWSAAQEKGYTNPTWMTYNQAAALGGQVRKGEKSEMIVYASKFQKDVKNESTGADEKKSIFFMKPFFVFNVEQIDNLPERFYLPKEPAAPVEETPKQKLERIEALDKFFAATGATVKHGGNRAFFSPGLDYIQMPELEKFRDIESYYSTKAHEAIHWTGHESRLARTFGKRFGDEAYAFEELVAELGNAFLCAVLGITPEVREDHASYLASWLKELKNDKRMIFTAASMAQKAVDHLQTYSAEPVGVTEEEDEEVAA